VAEPLVRDTCGPIDVVPFTAGVGGYEDLVGRAQPYEVSGRQVLVASLEDVIASTEALGRPKDRAHLPSLYALRARLASEDVV
jgi:hypothetical protein